MKPRMEVSSALFAGTAAVALGASVIYTQRFELLALIPLAIFGYFLLQNVRAAIIVAVCSALWWSSRAGIVLFATPVLASYPLYAGLALATGAVFLHLRVLSSGRPRPNYRPLFLMIIPLVLGSLHGATHLHEIPFHLLEGDTTWYQDSHGYFRFTTLQPMLITLLAALIARGVTFGMKPHDLLTPLFAWIAVISLLVMVSFHMEGGLEAAFDRSTYLTAALGHHSNSFGAILSTGYALLLFLLPEARGQRRIIVGLLLACVSIASILTFSRGAISAELLVTFAFFWKSHVRWKMVLAAALLATWILVPTEWLSGRFIIGMDTGDIDSISTGRIDRIWMPLFPDIAEHWLYGQGSHAILWTAAQRQGLILPVALAHNGYLDLLLDFGVLGTIPVLAFYGYMWSVLQRLVRQDADPRWRAFFTGGQWALVTFLFIALTNDRLTPLDWHVPLWIIFGAALGRLAFLRSPARERLQELSLSRPLPQPRLPNRTPAAGR